jgi:hypothetical protein
MKCGSGRISKELGRKAKQICGGLEVEGLDVERLDVEKT